MLEMSARESDPTVVIPKRFLRVLSCLRQRFPIQIEPQVSADNARALAGLPLWVFDLGTHLAGVFFAGMCDNSRRSDGVRVLWLGLDKQPLRCPVPAKEGGKRQDLWCVRSARCGRRVEAGAHRNRVNSSTHLQDNPPAPPKKITLNWCVVFDFIKN